MGGIEKDPEAEAPQAFRVIIRDQAANDLRKAYEWHEDQQDGLGERFKAAYEACEKKILSNPFLFNIVYRDVRRALMKPFQYKVIFTLRSNVIYIIAVIHAARAERRWKRRIDRIR